MAGRHRKSKTAFVLLTVTGSLLLFIALSSLVAGCFLVYHENFQELQEKISIEFDYSHYWVGGTYLITAVFMIYSGCRQNKRRLTFITAVFLIFSITLSMFAVVLDGPDWVEWKNTQRKLKFWEGKKGYSCPSKNATFCICGHESGLNKQLVSGLVECDKVILLTTIYGIIVSGSIIGFVLCLATVFIMVNSFSWKNPWKFYTSYTTSYFNRGNFSSLDDIMELYKQDNRYQTIVSSNNSTVARSNKDYTPAWSLYGSAADELHNNTGHY